MVCYLRLHDETVLILILKITHVLKNVFIYFKDLEEIDQVQTGI